MSETDQWRQEVALFRHGLIADLLNLPPGSPGLYQRLHEKAAREYTIPASRRTRVAAETLRDWLKRYRAGGFDALLPKRRADRGRPRGLSAAVADQLLGLKEANPKLSVRLLIAQARAEGLVDETVTLAPSTVHRLLARHGLLDPTPEAGDTRDRRRFAFERAGQLWMSDVMHGPAIVHSGARKRKTYLIALIDDATRVIPHAAFTFSENTQHFLPVFKHALLRRGLPERLYVDNGSNFRSKHLALICAKLGIALIHSRPYLPQGRGKIERFFKTVRAQLLPRLTETDRTSLEALNQRLWGWIEGEYHQSPHRGIDGDTPAERWARSSRAVSFLDAQLDLDELFLFDATRVVQKDCTVSLHGVLYEVDAAFIGERVTLRFDPARPGAPVQVCHHGQFIEIARPVDLYANCFVKRARPSDHAVADAPPDPPPASPLRWRDLKE